jgi:hypothetical protein
VLTPFHLQVFDACGRAGGGIVGGKVGGGAAFYIETIHAKEGDLGSKVLPPAPSGVAYKAGGAFEATWGMRANHGGGQFANSPRTAVMTVIGQTLRQSMCSACIPGYQYRLCPSASPLTESCLQAMPLPFAGVQQLQYTNGTRQVLPS